MTLYDWDVLLETAITKFGGQLPGNQLEEHIRTAFHEHPGLVTAAINRIASQYAAGTITSPWGVLRAELAKRAANSPKASDHADRTRELAAAHQWIRAAGLHFDRWPEVEDELFGDRGRLRTWPDLKPELQNAWTAAHITLEQEAA